MSLIIKGDYISMINSSRNAKKLSQIFLIDKNIAIREAEFAINKRVLEIGGGSGILTEELVKRANKVVSVEIDNNLFNITKNRLNYKNLELVKGNFFDMDFSTYGGFDILISNIPYHLSSKTIKWILYNRIPAILCLQKEFIDHIEAGPNTKKYSEISIISALMFSIRHIIKVPKQMFRPIPKVDSELISIRLNNKILDNEILNVLHTLMEHKKKKVKNAVSDSAKKFRIDKNQILDITKNLPVSDDRLFKLDPKTIYNISATILKYLKT